jgi:hypothetical protein
MSDAKKEPANEASAKKTCFVIGPIGADGGESRRKADFLLKGIILPAAAACGHEVEVTRADKIADPGLITEQIIEAVLDSDLVIADLSDQNPNAFYELAVRHSTDKPTIHMYPVGQSIPFDIKDYRAVSFDITDIDKLLVAENALAESMKVALSPGFKSSNPISRALRAKNLRASADPRDTVIADLSSKFDILSARLMSLENDKQNSLGFRATESDPHLTSWNYILRPHNEEPPMDEATFRRAIRALKFTRALAKSDPKKD